MLLLVRHLVTGSFLFLVVRHFLFFISGGFSSICSSLLLFVLLSNSSRGLFVVAFLQTLFLLRVFVPFRKTYFLVFVLPTVCPFFSLFPLLSSGWSSDLCGKPFLSVVSQCGHGVFTEVVEAGFDRCSHPSTGAVTA